MTDAFRALIRAPAQRSLADRFEVAFALAEAGLEVERARLTRELGDAAEAEAARVAGLRGRLAPGQGCAGFRDAMYRFEGKAR